MAVADEKYYTLAEISKQIEGRKGWERRRYEWEMSLVAYAAKGVSNEGLRNTLAMPPSERDEDGVVNNEDHVWGWVPCVYKGVSVSEELAKEVLADVTHVVLHERLKKMNNYRGMYYAGVEDG